MAYALWYRKFLGGFLIFEYFLRKKTRTIPNFLEVRLAFITCEWVTLSTHYSSGLSSSRNDHVTYDSHFYYFQIIFFSVVSYKQISTLFWSKMIHSNAVIKKIIRKYFFHWNTIPPASKKINFVFFSSYNNLTLL